MPIVASFELPPRYRFILRERGNLVSIYERTIEEVRRPLAEASGSGSNWRRITSPRWRILSAAAYRENGDATVFARDLTGFFRAFSEPSLTAGLAASDAAIDELYRRVQARLEREADSFVFEVNALTAVATRRELSRFRFGAPRHRGDWI